MKRPEWGRHRDRLRVRPLVLASLLAGLAGGCSSSPSDGAAASVSVESAEAFCPVLWSWVTEMGETFNAAAQDMFDLDEPEARRQRWFDALDRMEALDRRLLTDIEPIADEADGIVLRPLVAEVSSGVADSLAELENMRELIVGSPEIDERPRHQDRSAQLIVRVEKVIDVVKPELAALDPDGLLRQAFGQVPSCQHAVKDVDDGTARYNG